MEKFKENLMAKDPFTDILGQDNVKYNLKSALLSNRHIIIVGAPGIGKTTLAKNVASLLPEIEVMDCGFNCSPDNPTCPKCKAGKIKKKIKIPGSKRFIRVQGSPDLTAEDLIGDIDPIKAMEFGPLSIEAFSPGKIFKANNGVLFFDELNRAPEKLQNALLQILGEGKATIGSYDIDFEANFIFIGTMNPEDTSTEKLSDVLLDRFDIIYMTYPESAEIEEKIVITKGNKMDVMFPKEVLEKTVLFVRLLRESPLLEKHPSVRATIGLYERAQSNAIIKGKKGVSWEDVAEAAISVLTHRIRLKPSHKYLQSPGDFLKEQLEKFSEEHFKGGVG